MLLIIAVSCITLIAFFNFLAELRRDLMMMQQNSYRNERYTRWLKTSGDTTSWQRLTALCVLLISMSPFASSIVSFGIIAAFALGPLIYLTTRKYKKPLVWTPRAKRIYSVGIVISALLTLAITLCSQSSGIYSVLYVICLTFLGLYCGSHIIIMSSVWLLAPVERRINDGYRNDAARILSSMPGLTVIGITGSYGKTSTKHYLNRILSEQFEVLMTPGSYNTTLGVIRTIRELMKPYTEIFICEMGAKNIGDIKDICDLVHPSIGIVTAVGPQHLESFKTIENVC